MPNHTCFLIDDDEDDREIFELALAAANDSFTFISAKNGVDAIKMINDSPDFLPGFIFIDLNMPYMTGKECLAALKQIPRLANIPAIIYTTSSYSKDADEALALGASHFLVKPASILALTSALSTILNGVAPVYFLDAATVDSL
ncbi:response regulator [uncultured Flavobacterium sp.]|uniref:response regulator n=1 Tax=uncultured Flavobacterium sp. TaxID=165435 RepID=UPI0025D6BF21|nr:response regulator [uncultured Flavobacterium sp.]